MYGLAVTPYTRACTVVGVVPLVTWRLIAARAGLGTKPVCPLAYPWLLRSVMTFTAASAARSASTFSWFMRRAAVSIGLDIFCGTFGGPLMLLPELGSRTMLRNMLPLRALPE